MKLGDLATSLRVSLQGDPDYEIRALAPIERARPDELSFVVGRQFLNQLRETQAGAVIIPESLINDAPSQALIAEDPYECYARASWLLDPERLPPQGVDTLASVHPSAQIANSASIGPFVQIAANVTIGERVVVDAYCSVGEGSTVSEGTRLFPRVTIYPGCQLGCDCRVQSGAVIGSEGFGYAMSKEGWQGIQQVGGVRIGNRVHIGANTTIDRGAMDDTVIEDGVILDNQIQIAHNVQIGENTAIAGCVGIAGSTRIGRHCQIGGACNIVGHLTISDGVILNAASLVTQSIDTPGRYSSGTPLQPSAHWKRTYVSIGKLDELVRRIRRLEKHQEDQ
ncbi:MAG: UDP-3-O-(3-hydroxymyristoyl)glucosamine N-acyltransferase [Gammaproteobacteria bacterium]|nr:UDP-3-O-(3-hydroxymyristoyl)glucosamine N-acyltransferase [Gammaproteobacteria bacterium]